MEDFNQDSQFRDEFLWLEREQGRASKESKVERDLTQRVERLESKLEGVERKLEEVERKLKRSGDSQDNFKGDSKGTKKATETRLDAVNEKCRVRQADGYRTSFGEGIL